MVHEIQYRHQVYVLHSFELQQGVLVLVPLQHGAEEWGAGREDDLVGLQLVIITGESDIKKVFVLSKLSECCAYICLKVVPTEAKLFS